MVASLVSIPSPNLFFNKLRPILQHINRTATCVWKLLPRRSCLFRAPFTALGTSPRLKRRQRDRMFRVCSVVRGVQALLEAVLPRGGSLLRRFRRSQRPVPREAAAPGYRWRRAGPEYRPARPGGLAIRGRADREASGNGGASDVDGGRNSPHAENRRAPSAPTWEDAYRESAA